MATEKFIMCERCGQLPMPGILFCTLLNKARGDDLKCPKCGTFAELHLRFDIGLDATHNECTVLDCFIPRNPECWHRAEGSKVKFYPFFVILRRHGRNLAVWLPYWHIVKMDDQTLIRKYGQWAPFMDTNLFEDLLSQAQSKGYLLKDNP